MRNDGSFNRLFTVVSVGLLSVACSGAAQHSEGDGEPGSTTVSGTVRDGLDGMAVRGASVCDLGLGACSVVGDDGAFEMHAPEGSEVSLYAVAEGYHPARAAGYVSRGLARLEVPMIAADSVELRADAAHAAVLFRVIGFVGTEQSPEPGVEVHVDGHAVTYTNDAGRFDDTYAATGADGLALLPAVAPGSFDVAVDEAFGPTCRVLADGGLRLETTLELEAGAVTALDVFCY